MAKSKQRSNCPISMSLEVWGDKWTLLIIRDLLFEGKRTYGDFLQSDEGIATNILADRLRLLTQNKIIEQTLDTNAKSGKAYTLTKRGIDMLPIMVEMFVWADKYLEISDEVRMQIEIMKQDKQAFISHVKSGLTTNTVE